MDKIDLKFAVPIGALFGLFISEGYDFILENKLKNEIGGCPDAKCIEQKKEDYAKNKYTIMMIVAVVALMMGALISFNNSPGSVGHGLVLGAMMLIVYFTGKDWNMLNEVYLLFILLFALTIVSVASTLSGSHTFSKSQSASLSHIENIETPTSTQVGENINKLIEEMQSHGLDCVPSS